MDPEFLRSFNPTLCEVLYNPFRHSIPLIPFRYPGGQPSVAGEEGEQALAVDLEGELQQFIEVPYPIGRRTPISLRVSWSPPLQGGLSTRVRRVLSRNNSTSSIVVFYRNAPWKRPIFLLP